MRFRRFYFRNVFTRKTVEYNSEQITQIYVSCNKKHIKQQRKVTTVSHWNTTHFR